MTQALPIAYDGAGQPKRRAGMTMACVLESFLGG